MKRTRYFFLIAFVMLLSAGMLTACSGLYTDHSNLLEAGNIYQVVYEGDGGKYSGADRIKTYYHKDTLDNNQSIRLLEPKDGDLKGIQLPTRSGYRIKYWYYVDENNEEVLWNFNTEKVNKSMMTYNEVGGFYTFSIKPKWTVRYSYKLNYLYVDGQTFEVLPDSEQPEAEKRQSYEIALSDASQAEYKIQAYDLPIVWSGNTLLPPPGWDGHNPKPGVTYDVGVYEDKECTIEVRFPLPERLWATDENPVTQLYTKWLPGNYSIVLSARDITTLTNKNYLLWKDIDFENASVTSLNSVGTNDIEYSYTFLGNGHTLKNFTVNISQTRDKKYYGLFGSVNGGKIYDLTIENMTINFTVSVNTSPATSFGLFAARIANQVSTDPEGNTTTIYSEIKNVGMYDCRAYFTYRDASANTPVCGRYANNLYMFNDVATGAVLSNILSEGLVIIDSEK